MFRKMDGQAVGFRLYGNWTEYVSARLTGLHLARLLGCCMSRRR